MTQEEILKHNIECQKRKANNPGPWSEEVNRSNWRHAGLDCMIVRNPIMLHWCGYVGVTRWHPAYGVEYDKIDVRVHGGLTYSHRCHGDICHIDDESKDPIWWLGFDCAHTGDQVPAANRIKGLGILFKDRHYWTQAEVMQETNKLAEQLKKLKYPWQKKILASRREMQS